MIESFHVYSWIDVIPQIRRLTTSKANEQIDIWLTYVLLRPRLAVLHQLLLQIDVLGGVMTTSDIQLGASSIACDWGRIAAVLVHDRDNL